MKKLLPPTLFYICIAVMCILHFTVPVLKYSIFPYNLSGIIFMLLGLVLSIKGSNTFEKIGTNIKTFNDPDKLVTKGLYKYSRNPMYLGFVLVLIGINIIMGSITPCLVVLFFILTTQFWYIRFEEERMLAVFGDSYREYQMRTNRWFSLVDHW